MKKIFLFIALGLGLCACSDDTQLRDPDVVEIVIEDAIVMDSFYLFNDTIY